MALVWLGRFPGGVGLGEAFAPAVFVTVLNGLAQLQHGKIVQAFRDGGHHPRGGSRWAPWSDRHARRQARRGRTQVLVDTGRLRNTIRSRVERESGGVHQLAISADAPYAAFHQFGTRRLPARPVLEVTPADKADMARLVGVLAGRLLNGQGGA